MRVRYVPTKRWGTIEITQADDGLWYSQDGTCWAVREDSDSVDPVDRVGVGIASLPVSNPLTKDAKPHDYMYSSPAWQTFHTREESDQFLLDYIANDKEAGAWRLLALPFYWISRCFGGFFWERKQTR